MHKCYCNTCVTIIVVSFQPKDILQLWYCKKKKNARNKGGIYAEIVMIVPIFLLFHDMSAFCFPFLCSAHFSDRRGKAGNRRIASNTRSCCQSKGKMALHFRKNGAVSLPVFDSLFIFDNVCSVASLKLRCLNKIITSSYSF